MLLRQHILFVSGQHMGSKKKTLARDNLQSKGKRVSDRGKTIQEILDRLHNNKRVCEILAGFRGFLSTSSMAAKLSCSSALGKTPAQAPVSGIYPGSFSSTQPSPVAVASCWRPMLTGNVPLAPIWRPKRHEYFLILTTSFPLLRMAKWAKKDCQS